MTDRASQAVTFTGSATAFMGGLSANEIGIYGGLLIGVAGWLLNLWFKRRLLRIAERRGVNLESHDE